MCVLTAVPDGLRLGHTGPGIVGGELVAGRMGLADAELPGSSSLKSGELFSREQS